MKEPKNFKYISVITILTVIVLNCVVSTLAYLSYVNTIQDVVLFNLPDTVLSKTLRIAYSFGLILSVPIQISPMVDTVYRSTFLDSYIQVLKEKPRIKYYSAVVGILITCVT